MFYHTCTVQSNPSALLVVCTHVARLDTPALGKLFRALLGHVGNVGNNIHKALETVVRSVIMSDEIWGLKDVCVVMQSRIAKASIGSTRLNACGRCSCCKPPVVAFSADAGQFFETVSPSAAVRVTKKVLQRGAEISGRDSVTVLRGPKRQAFIGGSVARVDPSSYCFCFLTSC